MLLRVGLTGGIASGKSVVGRELERLGCHLIEADALGHQTLLPDGEAYEPVISLFGEAVLDPVTRSIDRKKLGQMVFHQPDKLAALNAIVHPAVRRLSEAMIREIPHGIVVYEAAILIETGGYKDFDRLIVAACPEELQVARAMARDGVDRDTVLARMRRQLPLAEKVVHAHYVIDTSGTLEQTLEQTRNVHQALVVYGENVT
jgi:dephospho-CoA kinase